MSLVKKREKYFKNKQKEFFEKLKTDIKNGKKRTDFYKEELERIGLEISDVSWFLLKHNITSSIVFIKKIEPYYVIRFYDSEEEYDRSIKDINKYFKKEKNGELLFEKKRLEEKFDFNKLDFFLLMVYLGVLLVGATLIVLRVL